MFFRGTFCTLCQLASPSLPSVQAFANSPSLLYLYLLLHLLQPILHLQLCTPPYFSSWVWGPSKEMHNARITTRKSQVRSSHQKNKTINKITCTPRCTPLAPLLPSPLFPHCHILNIFLLSNFSGNFQFQPHL